MAQDKSTAITIDNVEYQIQDLSDKAKYCLRHIGDLDRKIDSAKFTLDQLQVNRDAFSIMLKDELPKQSEQPMEANN